MNNKANQTNPAKRLVKLPPRKEIAALIRAVRADISPEFRAFEDDDRSGICLTVGANDRGNWSYQTGDNSFTGGAYGFPAWGVGYIYKDTNSLTEADEILGQLEDFLVAGKQMELEREAMKRKD